jgi:cytosine/adenosine deaminase-related metal-dependent hydrolase
LPAYRADWVLPIADGPIRDGWVTTDGDRITGLGAGRAAHAADLGRSVILPALVNAHTHLELSYLHRRVPPGTSFISWLRSLMDLRRQQPDSSAPEILAAARAAIASARASGTGLIGDISNTLVTVPLLRDAGMPAHVFHELLGFNVADPEERVGAAAAASTASGDVRVSLAPHAPYSVSPAMFRAIRSAIDERNVPLSSVHLGESADEIEFLKRGTGNFRRLLEDLRVWSAEWEPPGTSPVTYLSDLHFLDRSVLVVHGVQFDGADLSRLASLGTTIVSCPRSNVHVGVGSPPLEPFYAMNVNVAFGTDSLASVADLNLFLELQEARRIAPRLPARCLLESATLVGARALGFGDELGSIERGKRAALIAVRVPEGISDVEEYLVSGIEPADIQWLGS